eukprot:scaffold44_cov411-Prasinococcus_capsulatus_cf.AAC.15
MNVASSWARTRGWGAVLLALSLSGWYSTGSCFMTCEQGGFEREAQAPDAVLLEQFTPVSPQGMRMGNKSVHVLPERQTDYAVVAVRILISAPQAISHAQTGFCVQYSKATEPVRRPAHTTCGK